MSEPLPTLLICRCRLVFDLADPEDAEEYAWHECLEPWL